MSRTMPVECQHGTVIDWGDFGPCQDCDDHAGGSCPNFAFCERCEDAVEVRHVGYNPNPLYGGIGEVLDQQAADGFSLVRVVYVDPYRHVAVFHKAKP